VHIVDAHHHLWDTRSLHYDLLDGPLAALRRPYTVDDYRDAAATCGVTQSICVEAASAGASGPAETEWLLAETASSQIVSAIVAWAPIETPDLERHLDRLATVSSGRIAGVRRSLEFVPADFITDARVVEGVRRVGRSGYVFDLVLFQDNLPSVIELVRRCPEVQFVLDHMGKPQLVNGDTEFWSANLHTLGQLPNVACKISGLVSPDARAPRTPARLRPYIHHAIDCFGWERVLFGSDWPICNLAGGYRAWLETLRTCLSDARDTDLSMLFSENARRIYRLRTLGGAGWMAADRDTIAKEAPDASRS
jgi:L-fuconolactonase